MQPQRQCEIAPRFQVSVQAQVHTCNMFVILTVSSSRLNQTSVRLLKLIARDLFRKRYGIARFKVTQLEQIDSGHGKIRWRNKIIQLTHADAHTLRASISRPIVACDALFTADARLMSQTSQWSLKLHVSWWICTAEVCDCGECCPVFSRSVKFASYTTVDLRSNKVIQLSGNTRYKSIIRLTACFFHCYSLYFQLQKIYYPYLVYLIYKFWRNNFIVYRYTTTRSIVRLWLKYIVSKGPIAETICKTPVQLMAKLVTLRFIFADTWYLLTELKGISQTFGLLCRYPTTLPIAASQHFRIAVSDASPLHSLFFIHKQHSPYVTNSRNVKLSQFLLYLWHQQARGEKILAEQL